MRKGAKKKKKISKFYLIILLLLLAVFIISMAYIIKWINETNKSKQTISDIISNVVDDSGSDSSENRKIDFNKLIAMNSQVVGWIKIDSTNIDYPIVKGDNNDYYLHYNFLNEKSQNGWIFMDYRNSGDFSDFNTVIYGHNIKSGIMFSDLKNIYNGSITGNIYIDIYDTTGNLGRYLVYSCYMEKPDEFSINTNITEESYSSFLNDMKNKSKYNYNVETLSDGKTITLSTCDISGEYRILVHAIKNREE